MTPLAKRIAEQYCLPLKKRDMHDKLGFSDITKCHCFEMTEVIPLFEAIQDHRQQAEVDDYARQNLKYMFLPAPNTWIEWIPQKGLRWGYWLNEQDNRISMASAIAIDG